ncbi:hypothetical protein ACKWTF_015543 [Chironomus riparius]
MKISKKPAFYPREEELRVAVLRKTIPNSYFKYKAKLIKTLTKEAALHLLNDIKKCKSFLTKPKKCRKVKEQKESQVVVEYEGGYQEMAANLIKKFRIGKPPGKGEKKIVDPKSGKVMRLLYF